MNFRIVCLLGTVALCAVPVAAQTGAGAPDRPISIGAIGGLLAGQGDAGGNLGAAVAFDVSNRVAVEARGIHGNRGSGENGTEVSATMLFTFARSQRAAPYVGVGGGVYRASFDLGDARFMGMMSSQYPAGTQFVAIQGMPGFAMMGSGTTYAGMMWQGPWTGPTFSASQMPMFYADRLGPMMVSANGRWGKRAFTDPALTMGGGLTIDVSNRIFVRPDVRGLVVFASGDHMTLMTMNVACGVRF